MMLFRIGILLVVFLPSLVLAGWCEDEVAKLVWLESAIPIDDAKSAIESGDTRLLAIYGLGIEIPGISYKKSSKAFSGKNYRIIEGTGDDMCSENHALLNNMARKYATIYNKTLTESN